VRYANDCFVVVVVLPVDTEVPPLEEDADGEAGHMEWWVRHYYSLETAYMREMLHMQIVLWA
jgi:hypothetical protein